MATSLLILLAALGVGALGMFGGLTAAYFLTIKRASLSPARQAMILFAWPVFVVMGAAMIAEEWIESRQPATNLPETQIIGGDTDESEHDQTGCAGK